MSEQRSPSGLRYPLAVVACAGTFCLWVPILIGVGWFIFEKLDPWVDQQGLVLKFVLQCVLGGVLLVIFYGGWMLTSETWKHITHPFDPAVGLKCGEHAKWYPGYDPNADRPAPLPPEPENEHGHCPRCHQSSLWNGYHCGHCRFGED
jgi:hypothetical protein